MPRYLCRNTMALLVRPGLDGDDALALMVRSELVIGVSTPGNDPLCDYAMAILRRITSRDGRRRRTARATPDRSAVSASPPPGRNAYAHALESGAADLFLTDRSNARAAIADQAAQEPCARPRSPPISRSRRCMPSPHDAARPIPTRSWPR